MAPFCKSWSWGSNMYGKLGSDAKQGGPSPALFPRSAFPNVLQAEYGNEISKNLKNNFLSYDVWIGTGVSTSTIFLSNGTKGLLRIAAEINETMVANRHDSNVLLLSTNSTSERAVLKIARSGYRFALSQGLANMLGLYSTMFPAYGVLNEVSSRMQNNIVVYNVLVPGSNFGLQQSFFYFRAWNAIKQASQRISLPISDGQYNLTSLTWQVNIQLNAVKSIYGLNIKPFNLGNGDFADLTLYDASIVIDFELPNSVAEVLGFLPTPFPPNSWYGGLGIPNEVSSAAQTNSFAYRTRKGTYNLTFPPGVYSIDQIERMIGAGVLKAGNDPGAFSLFVGKDDRVVIFVLRAGYEAVFSSLNNIGQYLGFLDMDLPCNPAYIQPNLTEALVGSATLRPYCIARYATPNASLAVLCRNSSTAVARFGCGLSTSGGFAKRGFSARPLVSNFSSSGICFFKNGSVANALCACSGNGTLRACVSSDEASWTVEGVNASTALYNFSSCNCTKKLFFGQITARRKWGIAAQRSVSLPAGIYVSSPSTVVGSPTRNIADEISSAITSDLLLLSIYAQISMSIVVNTTFVSISFQVYSSESTVGIQIVFANSTISNVLGLTGNITLPNGRYMTINDNADLAENVLTYQYSSELPYFSNTLSVEANTTGEWLYKIAAGQFHTVVLTKHAYNSRFCLGNVNIQSGCFCFGTRLWSFGSNTYGQLGVSENLGSAVGNPDPILISYANAYRPECVVDVYAGGYHTAVVELLFRGERVWMFGRNNFGQLGMVPSLLEPATRLNSLIFGGLLSFSNVSLSLGPEHSIVLQSSRVWVFGKSFDISAQNNSTSILLELVTKEINCSWASVCTGNAFAILQDINGSIWSVGDNLYGQLGYSNYFTEPFTLYFVGESVPNLTSVSSFACGGDHVALLTSSGMLWTFGKNLFGELIRNENVGLNNQNYQPTEVDLSLFSRTSSDTPNSVMVVLAAGDFTLVQMGRLACIAGFFSSDGLGPCTPCNFGSFSDKNASISCETCVRGKYSFLGATTCMNCAFGKFSDVEGASACKTCPLGLNGTLGSAAISVDNCSAVCSAGQYGVEGLIPCKPCGPGYFSNFTAASACQPCALGQYQPFGNQSACLACVQNKSTALTGANSSAQCLFICGAGSFGLNGLANCTLCPMGNYAPFSRSSSCQLCPLDSYGNQTGMTFCFNCSGNTGTNGTGKSKQSDCLADCTPGQYSSNGLVPCKQCGPGNISSSLRSLKCTICPVASYVCNSASQCCACPSGMYLNSALKSKGIFTCQSCPAGTYSPVNQSTSCILCQQGKFSSSQSSTTCISCALLYNSTSYGTVSSGATSKSACQTVCTAGQWSKNGLPPCKNCSLGSISIPGSSYCESCSSGTYSSSASDECLACNNGTYSHKNASVCEQCPSGAFGPQQQLSTCTLCSPGTYASAAGQSICLDCDINQFSFGNGTVECTQCLSGKYQDQTRQSSCKNCPPGTYGDSSDGFSYCLDCNPGTYQNLPGQTLCDNCPPGTYSTQYRSQICWSCGAGTQQSSDGQSSCISCAAGTFSLYNMSQCLACAYGHYSNSSSTTCTRCQEGYNTSAEGSISENDCRRVCKAGEYGYNNGLANDNGTCDLCSPGTFSASSYFTVCISCPLGTFSGINMSSCSACEAGTYSAVIGSTNCTSCLKGHFQNQVGHSTCFPCPTGTFSPREMSIVCSNCSAGLFTFASASTHCSTCIRGKYAVPTGCLNCSSGFYSDGFGTCVPCPAGMFSENEGSSMCVSCPGGKSTAKVSANSSLDCVPVCPPGWYGASLGVNSSTEPCQLCTKGMYNRFWQQSVCTVCQPGSFSSSLGSISCSLCPKGYFSHLANQTSCLKCPNTEFPFNEETETLAEGSSDASSCRIFNSDACESSARHFGAYPVYTVGRNEYGESVGNSFYSVQPNLPKILDPYLITCDLLGSGEVYKFQTSGNHSFFLTVNSYDGILNDFFLWSVGNNRYGQLGVRQNAGTDNVNSLPLLLSRALFPNTTCGNFVSKLCGNNLFFYWRWNLQTNKNEIFNITISDGLYGPEDLALNIGKTASTVFGHNETFFQLEVNQTTQRSMVLIIQPGIQIDFTLPGSIRINLGFGSLKIPSTSSLNEISQRAGNTFTYRIWCQNSDGSICDSYRTINIVIPDGIYDLNRLNQEIQLTSLRDGTDPLFVTSDGFDLSWQLIRFDADAISDKVIMTVSGIGVQVIFSSSNSIAAFLGFELTNYPAFGPTNSSETQFEGQSPRGYLNSGANFKPFVGESSISGQTPVSFSLGADFTLIQTMDFVTNKTRLWAVGSNKFGQLGVTFGAGLDTANWIPVLLTEFDELSGGKKALTFKTGASHTFVVDYRSDLWAFGSNEFGQLAQQQNNGTQIPNPTPSKIILSSSPNKQIVNEISARNSNNRILIQWSNSSYILNISDGIYTEDDLNDIETQLNADLCDYGAVCEYLNLRFSLIDNSKIGIELYVFRGTVYMGFQNLETAHLFGFAATSLNPPCSASSSVCRYIAQSDSMLFFIGRNLVDQISLGEYHSLVQTVNSYSGLQTLWAWGSNLYGQIGTFENLCQYSDGLYKPCDDGTSYISTPFSLPLKLFSNRSITSFVAGGYHSLVQDESSAVWCFGWNRYGQCGYSIPLIATQELANPIPSLVQFQSSALIPPVNHSVVDFQGGLSHTIFKVENDALLSVGSNAFGQLVRTTNNLGNENPDYYPSFINVIGNADQLILDYVACSYQSFIQTMRPYCRKGFHSIDGRSPC